METLQAIEGGRWAVLTETDDGRILLDIYVQEEELAPPFKVDSFTVNLGRPTRSRGSRKSTSPDSEMPPIAFGLGAASPAP
jgi:hypothetical protein